MKNSKKPIANPYVVLREEFDDWAILFNPDADLGHNGFGLNPTGVYLWKLLDGEHSIDDMLKGLSRDSEKVPQEAGEHLVAFVEELIAEGLAGSGMEQDQRYRARTSPCPTSVSDSEPAEEKGKLPGQIPAERCIYAKPCLVCLSSMQVAEGKCNGGSFVSGGCNTYGHGPGNGNCKNGPAASILCSTGTGT